MSFLDQLAFGPGGDRKAWARGLLIALAVLALAGGLLYYTVSGDYAFLRASILTGSPTGAYHALGERLAARALKKNGHLKVVATAGSIENIARLAGENGRCVPAFAFVQDGVADARRRGLSDPWAAAAAGDRCSCWRGGGGPSTLSMTSKAIRSGSARKVRAPTYLMQQLLQNSDLAGLDLRPSNHDLEAQAGLVRDGQLDLAAFVMNENAEMVRALANKYDLEIVAPADIEGPRGARQVAAAWAESPPATTTSPNRSPRPTSSSRRSIRSS